MHKTFNYKSGIIKGCIAFAIATGVTLSPGVINNHSFAVENNTTMANENDSGILQVVNEEQAIFKLNKDVDYQLNNDGSAILINKVTNQSAKLPVEGKDKDNKKIKYVYTEDNNHLVLNAVSEEVTATRSAGECISGIAGEGALGAGGIGAAGAGVGAAGGTIVIPGIGTAAGATGVGALGAAVGGIGGSLKGAADHCFK